MNSYKLIQFLKTYISPERKEIPILIWLHTACNWLRKLGYEYKNIRKDIFVDGHKRLDIMENWKNFLQKMEELKPYIVEFDKNCAMKPKIYPVDCAVGEINQRPIIVIIYDEYTFLANDRI